MSKSENNSINTAGKTKKKRNPIVSFLRTVIIIVACFLVISFVGVYAYTKASYSSEDGSSSSPSVTEVLGNMLKDDINTNILVCGVDGAETRTDVIFVVNFDSESGTIKFLSIPRDTYTEIIPEVKELVENEGRFIPSVCKLNAVHAYGGDEGMQCLELQLEDLLGVKIDNYVKFNIKAFKSVVDIIDGVDMYVPQDMYYSDPVQNLYINLKEGQQHLDGDTAEQLVRFRKYTNGDLGRIEVQHLFLSAFFQKVTSSETLVKNAPQLIKAAFEYLDTDMSVGDMLKYSSYISDIKSSDFLMETIPGYPQYINGASYYIADDNAISETVDEIFYSSDEYVASSKHKSIEVANGGDIIGLASRVRDFLDDEGFTVSKISTYKGDQTEYTRIVVKENGQGEDLLQYFDNAVIIVDDTLLGGNDDILIILGTEQGEITANANTAE